MPYRALALDMDGTLLNETGEIEPSVHAALLRARSAGIPIFLASGRMHPAIVPYWEAIGLDTPIISYNGGKIQRPGEPPVHEARLPAAVTQDAIHHCREKDLHLNAYFEDKLFVFQKNEIADWYAAHFRIPLHILEHDQPWPAESPAKLLAIVKQEEDLAAAFEDLHAAFHHRADLTTSSRRFVEFLPPGTSKGAGLRWVAEAYGIPAEDFVGIGDGMNDRPLLEAAGLGLAVANGDPKLFPYADAVVPPLYEGGLEQVLAQHFLVHA